MTHLKRLAIALACLMWPLAPAAADCNLSLIGPVAPPPVVYNPFQAGAATAEVSFSVKNSAAKPCSASFAFFKLGAPQASRAGASLAYRLLDGFGSSITQSAATPPPKLASIGGAAAIAIGANETKTTTVQVSVTEGQVLGPGLYTDQLILAVYQDQTNSSVFTKAFEYNVNVSIAINSQMTLAIAGGGRHTTLNFGELVEHASRSVNLQAYSNQGFHLTLSSDNAGVMKPTDPASLAEGWRVPYSVKVLGTGPIDLAQQQSVSLWPQATQRTGLVIPVEVQIGATKGQRAGIYRDVITIAIAPGL
jgi:hypothetical protein